MQLPQNPFTTATRTAEQIEARLKQLIAIHLPEIKDPDKDIWVRGTKIQGWIFENLHWYIDFFLAEAMGITTCKLYTSALIHARNNDYRVKGLKAHTTTLRFTLDSPATADYTIPAGTICLAGDIPYRTLTDATINLNETVVDVEAEQSILVENIVAGVTDGSANQIIYLTSAQDDTLNTEGVGIVDKSISVTIGANNYAPVDSFIDSYQDDRHFIPAMRQNIDTPEIVTALEFGDDINSEIPAVGQDIVVSYYVTYGSLGKAAVDTVTTIGTPLSPPDFIGITVTNTIASSGGKDYESLAELKQHIPRLRHITEAAVTRADYQYLAELIDGVAKAGIVYDFGTLIEIFILPEGGGVASPAFLVDFYNQFVDKKIICTQIAAYSAGSIEVYLDATLYILPNYVADDVKAEVIEQILLLGDTEVQEIGDRIGPDDIVDKARNVEGLDQIVINELTLRPYAQPVSPNADVLLWTRKMLSGSTTAKTFTIRFTDTTHFDVIRDEVFVGNFEVGNDVDLAEVSFNLDAGSTYAAEQTWIFKTYRYLGKESGLYTLSEPSVFEFLETNLVLSTNGGI